MPDTSSTRVTVKPGCFATTHWSVVLKATNPDAPLFQEALQSLCKAYWYPLYAYARRRGHSVEDAQDLTQQFFAQLLDRKLFAKADREKGRFRNFLLSAMEHFLANQWDRARAQKRGGGKTVVPIQIGEAESRYGVEPADDRTPEQVFEYNWAVALLEQVIGKLGADFAAKGQSEQWELLKNCLVASPSAEARVELARRLNMTEGTLRVAVHRLRTRYRELLRSEIASTLESELEVESEMRHLFKVLARK